MIRRAHSRLVRKLFFTLLAFSLVGLSVPATAKATTVKVGDDFFERSVLRIEPGGTVTWDYIALLTHTVTSVEGHFNSGPLSRGKSFSHRFDEEGAFSYFCVFHGAPGAGMTGVVLVGDAAAPDKPPRKHPRAEGPATLRVPEDFTGVQQAVDAAHEKDTVSIAPGTYHEAVVVRTSDLTIRGRDRHDVVFDGEFSSPNAFLVAADGVAIENLTTMNYLVNGLYFNGVHNYRASYVSAIRNGDYGIYVIESRGGVLEHVYASGSPDGGLYIGSCYPCDAAVRDSFAEFNELGFSGTNAGGNLIIERSEWANNRSGILPNTLDSEHGAPQRRAVIRNNYVHDNGDARAPFKLLHYPVLGVGIAVVGAEDNVIQNNEVIDNSEYGILIMPSVDLRFWMSYRNIVEGNVVGGSGKADLVIAAISGFGNCFRGNSHATSIPPGIESLYRCGSPLNRLGGGDFFAGIDRLALFARSLSGEPKSPDWKSAPHPNSAFQPDMPADFVASRPPVRVVETIPIRLAKEERMLTTLLGIYAYALPLALYATWMAVSIWDLARREDLTGTVRVLWALIVVALPFAGPIIYLAAKSSVQTGLRLFLVFGGVAIYALLAAASFAGLAL